MTIADLIHELQKHEPILPVYVLDKEGDWVPLVALSVEQAHYDKLGEQDNFIAYLVP